MQKLNNGIEITYMGHATFKVKTPGGKTLIIDPWVEGNPMCPHELRKVDQLDIMPSRTLTMTTLATALLLAKSTSQRWWVFLKHAFGWAIKVLRTYCP